MSSPGCPGFEDAVFDTEVGLFRSGRRKKPVVCKRCNESNEFAEPNQPDGGFKCYGCRQPGVY